MRIAALSLGLHVLAATIWVGGMAFAWLFLRPAAVEVLAGPERQQLWRAIFRRFFPVVWAAVIVLLLTGYHLVFTLFGGFAAAGTHVHVMHALGLLMAVIYLYIFAAPWGRFRRAVDATDFGTGSGELARIRRLVGVNLVLGLIVVAVASAGRLWG